jgi:hypothetical protein
MAFGGIARQHRLAVGLAPDPEGRIVDQPIFGDLGIARQQLAPGQAIQHVGIGKHQPRLVEGADEVLAMTRVDAGLAADRGIDLRQQGRRDLDEIDAAQQGGGGKARQVPDHAAAQRDQRGLTVGPLVEQRVHQVAEGAELLAALACRHGNGARLEAGVGERGHHTSAIKRRHGFVGHHDDPPRRQQGSAEFAHAIDQPGSDQDVVAAAGEVDRNSARRVHAAAPSACGVR